MSDRLLAIGDIHGCFDPFRELIERQIDLRKEDRLILLGDYIDRGNNSREVIDYILDLQGKGYNIVCLTGNHEVMMLDSVNSEKSLYNWYINGGYETLFSFGIESADELSARHLSFFKALSWYYSEGSFIFVHAGFNDEIADPFEDRVQMVWSRRESYSNPVLGGKVIIHGHTPITISVCRENVMSGNRVINIDTGCVYGGYGGYGHLTGIDINSRQLYSV